MCRAQEDSVAVSCLLLLPNLGKLHDTKDLLGRCLGHLDTALS